MAGSGEGQISGPGVLWGCLKAWGMGRGQCGIGEGPSVAASFLHKQVKCS